MELGLEQTRIVVARAVDTANIHIVLVNVALRFVVLGIVLAFVLIVLVLVLALRLIVLVLTPAVVGMIIATGRLDGGAIHHQIYSKAELYDWKATA
jgi:hypothetical protein